tara:strand:+ start:896 stop:1315 length:420 start_codon:yes stop_codon:yes gene_type:complete
MKKMLLQIALGVVFSNVIYSSHNTQLSHLQTMGVYASQSPERKAWDQGSFSYRLPVSKWKAAKQLAEDFFYRKQVAEKEFFCTQLAIDLVQQGNAGLRLLENMKADEEVYLEQLAKYRKRKHLEGLVDSPEKEEGNEAV